MKKIIIKKEKAGARLDKFLMQEVFLNLETTRGEIIRNINSGNILVNNKQVKPSHILRPGDTISSKFKVQSSKLSLNKNLDVAVVYQDKNIIVVNKPAGISVHPVKASEKNTLVNFLIAKFPEIENVYDNSKDAYLRPGIVHRLDKDTSGVMAVARNQKTFEELKKLFQDHEIEKKYLALVYGRLEDKKGIIEKPIARSATYRKQVIAGRKTKTKIREAVTEFRVVREFGGYSLVEALPKTGRMHQIRVHFFSIGHPIVGDKLYALKKYKKAEVARQLLHAKSLKFELGGKKYFFKAPIPKDIGDFMASIDPV